MIRETIQISPLKHSLICKLCLRVEKRTPPEVIAKVTGYGMPITYDHLNWVFDRSYDMLATHSVAWLLVIYLLGGQGVRLG
jgi:hypothetical protein